LRTRPSRYLAFALLAHRGYTRAPYLRATDRIRQSPGVIGQHGPTVGLGRQAWSKYRKKVLTTAWILGKRLPLSSAEMKGQFAAGRRSMRSPCTEFPAVRRGVCSPMRESSGNGCSSLRSCIPAARHKKPRLRPFWSLPGDPVFDRLASGSSLRALPVCSW